MPSKSRTALQVTLTDKDTNYRLADLIAAIDPAAAVCFRRLQLQSESLNAAAIVLAGDSELSATRYGYSLLAGDFGPVYQDVTPSMSTLDLYLRSDTDGAKVNVEGLL